MSRDRIGDKFIRDVNFRAICIELAVGADHTVERTGSHGTRPRAAKDPSRRFAIAASVIVTGLATVLAWQFHARGPAPGQRPDAASWNIAADKRLAAAPPASGAEKASEPLPPESKASAAPAPNAVTAPSRQRLVAQAEIQTNHLQ